MRKRAALAGMVLACVYATAHAENYTPAVKQVLAKAHAATGGNAWNGLRTWHEVGVQNGVRYESWTDLLRYGARLETHEADGVLVHAFNGLADWHMRPSGQIRGVNDPASMAKARATAFFGGYGFFFPSRYAVRGSHIGVRKNGGRDYDVLRIQPYGAEPRELWFDRRTRLLARIVDRTGPRPVTVEISDYRRTGPVMAAFRYTIDNGDPAARQVRQVQTIDFPQPDRSLFSTPPPVVRPVVVPPPPAPPPKPRRSLFGKILKPTPPPSAPDQR